MKASVVVPLYNMAKYVGQCIDSILCQTLADFEIIVVDDCSTDNSVEVVKSYTDKRIRLVQREKNGGVTAAVNDGLLLARGDYVCPLGADDMFEPWMLEKQSAYLDAHPEIAAVFGMPLTMNEKGEVYPVEGRFTKPENRSRFEWFSTLLESNALMGQTCLYRRTLHDTLGLWDEKVGAGNDVDWFIRIVKEHDIHVQHIPMARIRMRDDVNQLSADSSKNRRKLYAEMDYIREKHDQKKKFHLNYKGSLLIATPFHNQLGNTNYVKSIITTCRFLEKVGVDFDWIDFDATDNIGRAKNAMCARFLEGKHTDLMFIDSDKWWNPLGIARLLVHDEEIVAGAYPSETWSVKLKLSDGIPTGKVKDSGALLEADFVSSGFIRFKRPALQKFVDEYPDLKYTDKDSGMAFDYLCTAFFEPTLSESGDEAFCRRWRQIGQLWVEPQIDFEIAAVSKITGNLDKYYRDLKEQERQLKGEATCP